MGTPPDADTFCSGVVALVPNRMIPFWFHVPPRKSGLSHNVSGGPPPTSIRLIFSSAKNPIDRLSGDQNGPAAPSVPGSSCAVMLSSDLTHSRLRPVATFARNAIRRPSGETANPAGVPPGALVRALSVVSVHPPGGATTKRNICGSASVRRMYSVPPRAAMVTSNTAAAIQPRLSITGAGAGSARAGSSITKSAVEMSAIRRLRSFSRHRWISVRIATGISGGNAVQTGSLLSTEASVSLTSSPSNARRPVSISYSTQPNAHTSDRLSASRPLACSGDMYAAVPIMTPWPVIIAGEVIVGEFEISPRRPDTGSSALARPKSRTFTVPSGRSLMLAGLRSRWMMFCSCAA